MKPLAFLTTAALLLLPLAANAQSYSLKCGFSQCPQEDNIQMIVDSAGVRLAVVCHYGREITSYIIGPQRGRGDSRLANGGYFVNYPGSVAECKRNAHKVVNFFNRRITAQNCSASLYRTYGYVDGGMLRQCIDRSGPW
jgi:hypothetical protein